MLHNKSLYNLLFEQDSQVNNAPEGNVKLSNTKVKARKSLNSIDKQIDALLLKYEAKSILEDDDMLNEVSKLSLKFLLLEQEEEEAAGEEEAEDTDATDADTGTSGAEGMQANKPGKEETPNLDVDEFTLKCVRLITNYKNLLRVEEAIINRIRNFLDNNYGDEHVQRFLETLENDYGLSVDEFSQDAGDNNEPDRYAIGAKTGGGA